MKITDLIETVGGKQPPMKATDLLRMDHARVRDLFGQYRSLMDEDTGNVEKKELWKEIEREVSVHSRVEEEIFYPAVRKASGEDSEKLVLESYEEHALVDQLLEQLGRMRPDDETFDAKVKVLMDLVEHHVDEEENELFPDAEEMGDRSLDRLGKQIAERKQQLMTEGTSRRSSGRGRTASRRRSPARSTRRRSSSRTTRSTSRTRVTRSTRSARGTASRTGTRAGAKRSSKSAAASGSRARGRKKSTRSSPSRRSSR